MKIKIKIVLMFLLLIIPIGLIGYFSLVDMAILEKSLSLGITTGMENIDKNSRLNSLAQFIRYYDEVLTQSARNYAFTGDVYWKTRYEEVVPLLDKNIKEVITLGDQRDKDLFAGVDSANLALIEMEENAMSLVSQGRKKEAVVILESPAYAYQKSRYQAALVEYAEKQGKQYSDALITSQTEIEQSLLNFSQSLEAGKWWTLVGVGITGALAILLGLITGQLISKRLSVLNSATKDIIRGKLNRKVEIKTKDEIGELAETFNLMVASLKEARTNIEAKVTQRTAELEKTNKFMVGRELKMIELKEKIKKLENSQ